MTRADPAEFDLGAFVGDLTADDDASSQDISLEGLQQELEECINDEVVANILSKGTKLRDYTKGVENNLRQVELDSIQDYIEESDNLVSLHDQIRDCDNILSQMETLLSGFQVYSAVNNHGGLCSIHRYNEQVLSAHFRAYIQALGTLQLDIATSADLIGVETRSSGLFSRGREPLKNRSAVFALGERLTILKEIEEPALIPHIAEANSKKYPYEVLFRSLHKLLMDTATSEYLFCDDFFGEESIFNEIFSGPFAAIDEHFNSIFPKFFDAIGIMLMIRIIHQHQLIMSRRRFPCLDSYLDKVNIALWPRFKMVFDMHLNSLRNANVRTLWEDDVHPHYVMRRYAEFTASLIHLNVEYGDGQLDLSSERLRMAVDDLLVKLAKTFPKPKQQTVSDKQLRHDNCRIEGRATSRAFQRSYQVCEDQSLGGSKWWWVRQGNKRR